MTQIEFDNLLDMARSKVTEFDKMVHSCNEIERLAVAELGDDRHLDILVRDESVLVRMEVAYRGRTKDLIILINDESDFVKKTARNTLRRRINKLKNSSNPHKVSYNHYSYSAIMSRFRLRKAERLKKEDA